MKATNGVSPHLMALGLNVPDVLLLSLGSLLVAPFGYSPAASREGRQRLRGVGGDVAKASKLVLTVTR